MSYVVLSDETKATLEQERLRLMNDRSKIVSELEAAIGAEVDQVIATLNVLLHKSLIEAVSAADPVEVVTEPFNRAETFTKPSRTRKTGTKKSKPEVKETSNLSPVFDAKQLKRKFKGMDLSVAIVQVLQQNPTREYETDALIAALYDEFDPAQMPKARKTIGATLMHQRRAGVVEKIGDKSPRYKLGQESTVSA